MIDFKQNGTVLNKSAGGSSSTEQSEYVVRFHFVGLPKRPMSSQIAGLFLSHIPSLFSLERGLRFHFSFAFTKDLCHKERMMTWRILRGSHERMKPILLQPTLGSKYLRWESWWCCSTREHMMRMRSTWLLPLLLRQDFSAVPATTGTAARELK